MEHWRNGKQEPSRRRQHTRFAHAPQTQRKHTSTALRFDDSDELFHGSDSAFADAEPSPSSQYTFTEHDGDTEEDELMRMIIEKERQEADDEQDLARVAAQADRVRAKKEQRNKAPVPRPFHSDDFYSPVRPADDADRAPSTEHKHAPFRVGRVVAHNRAQSQQAQPQQAHQQQRRRVQLPERSARFANVDAGGVATGVDRVADNHSHDDNSHVQGTGGSNQMEHEPRQQQQQQRSRTTAQLASQKSTATHQRLRTTDDVWDHFISGTSSDGPAVSPYPTADDHSLDSQASSHSIRQQQLKRPLRTNIFREEISVPTPLNDGASVPTDKEQPQQSRNYSAESIPTVSYTPPMSPTAASSRWSSANDAGRYRQTGGTGGRSLGGQGNDDDPNGPHHYSDSATAAPSSVQLHHTSSHAVFPFWSVAFLTVCALVGTGGFFVEDVLDALGKFSSRASVLSLSRDEQQQMHTRLEQLQSEIHGFRATASEIELHSQRVFDEMKAHLSRMKREREKHQTMIAREMTDLRAYMLHVMSDMVEQERELIHARLRPVESATDESDSRSSDAGVDENSSSKTSEKDPATDAGVHDVQHETISSTDSINSVAGGISSANVVVQVEHQTIETHLPTVDIPTDMAAPVNVVESAPTAADAVGIADVASSVAAPKLQQPTLSKGQSVMLLSWELLMMLAAISILGGLVGIRVRNINRRKRWHEQRRARREQLEQLERERAARMGDLDDDESGTEVDDVDDDDDDDDAATEYSDETASRSGGDASTSDVDSVDDDDRSNNSDADGDDSAAESSGVETVSLMRLATGNTPTSSSKRAKSRRARLRAMSTDAEDDDDASDDDSDSNKRGADSSNNNNSNVQGGLQTPQTKKNARYSFVDESPGRRRSPRLEGHRTQHPR